MKWSGPLFAGAFLASAFTFPTTAVLAQDSGAMQVGGATVTIGGGTALLTLPDVPSLITSQTVTGVLGDPSTFAGGFKFSDDFGDETGWNGNASIAVPMTGANGNPKTVSLNGFWASIEDTDTASCTANTAGGPGQVCVITALSDGPGAERTGTTAAGETISSRAEREIANWGLSLESKWQLTPNIMGLTRAPNRRYLALGAEIRAIDQDLDAAITFTTPGFTPASYDEELDTRYYGVYAAWGGDYTLPFLGGFTSGWGLQSSFLLRGGIYHAETDFDGVLTDGTSNLQLASSALSLSRDDTAFIGGLVLETRKRIGPRTTLSLKSDYEYYSYVPEMAYNQLDVNAAPANPVGVGGQDGTVINDDDAFSARTSLRLTIGLGPDSLYQ